MNHFDKCLICLKSMSGFMFYHKNCFDLRPNRYIKKGIRGYIRTRQEVIQSIKDEIDLNWKPTPYFEKTDDYWHFEHLLEIIDAGFH